MISSRFDTDVFVVGGGPAGLAAAVACRRKGFRVIVADSARPPIDKACGEGIMPDGLEALRELGFHLASAEPAAFRTICFVDADVSAEAAFPIGHGLGVRRTALHSAMAATAESAGVEMLWGAHVTGISAEGAFLGDRLIRSRWIIGADGSRSRVRAWAGLEAGTRPRSRFGFRRHYSVTQDARREPGCMELHWGRDAQIYVTPVGPAEVCAVVISRDPHLRLEQALAGFPGVTARLGAPKGRPEVGAVTATRKLRCVAKGQVALVGDASGSVDAITGEGLCLSFRQSLALADALEHGDLAGYERAHRGLMRRPAGMANLLLLLGREPRLRRHVLSAFAARSKLFEKMLAAHVSAIPPAGLAADGLALGWQVIWRSCL